MRKATAILLFFLILLSGCRSSKFVPVGDYLLDDVKIESDDKEIKPDDVQPYIKQKPNEKIAGVVKFRLWLYNCAPKNGDGWVSKLFKKMGDEPIIYDENYTTQTESEIERYLINKGFTSGDVTSVVSTNEKKHKKVVTYQLECNTPYRIAECNVEVNDTTIAHFISEKSSKTLVKEGDLFDLDVLDEERERITAELKNNGYYEFNKEAFGYEVDTTLGDYQVSGTLVLITDTANLQHRFEQYHINNVNFIVGYDAQKALKDKNYLNRMQSVVFRGMRFFSEGEIELKPEIIYRNNLLKPGDFYNKEFSNKTHSMLSAISIIQYVNINYTKIDTGLLDCNIFISLAEQQDVSSEIEGTNISGNIGAAINLGYAHKNLFHGGEKLNTSFTIGWEALIGINDVEVYNSRELGADVNLTYPKFVFPFLNEDFKQRSQAQTKFGVSYNYQKRPQYVRDIATTEIVYNWKTTDRIKHQYTPIMLNYINISDMTDAFHEHIDTTQYLKYSYEDHVIFGSRYSISFQKDQEDDNDYGYYLRFAIESSGNMLNMFNSLTGQEKIENEDESYYEFFNLRYSSYVKFDATAFFTNYINKSNTLAYRTQFGIGIPYKNSSQLPFEKRYAGGGANGVRAWMVRSLGPGSYYNDEVDYYNQSGDINLILSAEYRFKLIGIFNGALFADAGNTWAIRDYEEQPGAVFKFDTFYKQIAAGIGTGIRLDIKVFILRLDFAWKALDPTESYGERWVLGKDLTPTAHFALGYPF